MAKELHIVPLSWAAACEFIRKHHRHHKPPRGQKFAIGVVTNNGQLVGVATCGRPSARHLDDGLTLEVNRTCTDGHKNANSALYGAAYRVAAAMGYQSIITYTQQDESGSSLLGADWLLETDLAPRESWAKSSPKYSYLRDPEGSGGVARRRWRKYIQQHLTGGEQGDGK